MKAIVIGAGIGGLSAAIALRKVGIEPVIFERTRELREIGAGVSLTANATRALNGLGLADALREVGVPVEVADIRTWRGEVLSSIPVWRLDEKVGARSAAMHRADLQGVLLRELGEGVVRLGAACTGLAQEDRSVRASFADGTEERGDLLVGADGLRSTIRERLLGDGTPRYAGYTTWRAVVTPESELAPAKALEVWGRGVRFICARVGRGRVYWAVSKNAPEGEHDVPDGGVKDVLLQLCAGWIEPIETLISATEASDILRTDVYDRDPLSQRWGVGRATLLGDAAHPMTPDLGQGACQAIEDAVALASCLSDKTMTVAAALELYEARRTKRTARLVRGSRRIGRITQLQNPLLCRLRDAALKALPTKLQIKQLEAVMGYEE